MIKTIQNFLKYVWTFKALLILIKILHHFFLQLLPPEIYSKSPPKCIVGAISLWKSGNIGKHHPMMNFEKREFIISYAFQKHNDIPELFTLRFWPGSGINRNSLYIPDPGQKCKQLWNVIIPQVCTEMINEMIILAIESENFIFLYRKDVFETVNNLQIWTATLQSQDLFIHSFFIRNWL